VLGRDLLALAQQERTFHHIAQLPDVPGPGVADEQVLRLGRQLGRWVAIHGRGHLCGERARHGQDLRGSLPQGRDVQRDPVEPEVEVGAELLLRHLSLQVLVGGGHETDVDDARLERPDARDLSGLDHPQTTCLQGQGHLPDLVEQHRSSGRRLEQPGLAATAPVKAPRS